jgi:uncharacterized protein YkwD
MRRRLALLALTAALVLPAAAEAAFPGTEAAVRNCANQVRRAHGLRPLVDSPTLDRAARTHARNMARLRFFSHTDPWGRGPEERVAPFDPGGHLILIGENIAAGYRTAGAACRAWLASPGHRENLLDRRYSRIGAGVWRASNGTPYYVQDFAVRH